MPKAGILRSMTAFGLTMPLAVASLIFSLLSRAAPLRVSGSVSRLARCWPLPLSRIHSTAPWIIPAGAADAAGMSSPGHAWAFPVFPDWDGALAPPCVLDA